MANVANSSLGSGAVHLIEDLLLPGGSKASSSRVQMVTGDPEMPSLGAQIITPTAYGIGIAAARVALWCAATIVALQASSLSEGQDSEQGYSKNPALTEVGRVDSQNHNQPNGLAIAAVVAALFVLSTNPRLTKCRNSVDY